MAELLDEDWLTVKAVARKLNVSVQEIYELIKFGQLKAIRIGRSIRVPRRYLEEFVKERADATFRAS